MGQVILGAVGGAIGGPFGSGIGRLVGGMLDRALVAGLERPRQRGPRQPGLQIQGTSEGVPLPCVFGRARVTGQMIWAANFLESRRTSAAGGKGGPRTVEYGYSLSFAVALCEGEIDGIGRVWADGQPLNLADVTFRIHRGGPDQAPDPLIEAIEGVAPAYRGVAYAVFEDLPLGPFGNRPPQLAFEVFRRPRGDTARLEDRLEGVCLIPGAGEFVLATAPVLRREGLTRTTPENVHASEGRSDVIVSLDQLQAHCPNLKRVSLVIGWFGDDLRASHCRVRPGVERQEKPTEPHAWAAAGLNRDSAHRISSVDGGPAYGGTPSDESVRQAVAELKGRGLEVTLYPFVFMDIPPGNGLPDPYGGPEQAAFPWRGRVCGRNGAEASADVAALFGSPDTWGLRRLALHYAAIAAECGADGLLIGSEMRGLTLTRDGAGDFPAVAQFRALAVECRAIVGPDIRLSYAADWSEYAGLRQGSEVAFHLDPLWADPAIDHVSIDWYPPMGDWRAGEGGIDAGLYGAADDPAYLRTQVAGGEGFDWFYASDEDRAAQVRTPIIDAGHEEPWVFRVKDLAGWWSHVHHDRPGGVRRPQPTAWLPGMKPVRLTEFGCAAVDRGANAPNLFEDPKSAESALPPFSTGERDDRIQRRTLEAVLEYYAAHNPISSHYGGRMLAAADAWCWDARPWPAFPTRGDVWADAPRWRSGHWLNGRLGGEARDLVVALLRRAGLGDDDFRVGQIPDGVSGYVIDRPMPTRDALGPLAAALGLFLAERGGRVTVGGREPAAHTIFPDSLALPADGAALFEERKLEVPPDAARLRFIDGAADYRTGTVVARRSAGAGGLDLDLPAVCSSAVARAAAELALGASAATSITIRPGPLDALRLEAGDVVTISRRPGEWRVARIDLDELPSAVLEPVRWLDVEADDAIGRPPEPPVITGAPFFRMVDGPPLPGEESDSRPLPIVAASPWRPMQVVAGPAPEALTRRAELSEPAVVGRLSAPLPAGLRHRWDESGALVVEPEGGEPGSRPTSAVLGGANALLVESGDEWELLQFRRAEPVAVGTWRLTGLLRGQQGTTARGAPVGAVVVLLSGRPERADLPANESGLPLVWRAGPLDAPAGGAGVTELVWTPREAARRPWSPAHVRAAVRPDGGFDLTWLPRSRLGGDRWEGELAPADPLRFRIRVLDGQTEVRAFEATALHAGYAGAEMAADFPAGADTLRFGVSQWGEGWGWGSEAQVAAGVSLAGAFAYRR